MPSSTSSSRFLPLRRLLLATLLAASLSMLLVAGETVTPDGLLSKLDKRDRVTLTAADGTQRDISVEEMERLARTQQQQQAQMHREAAATNAARKRQSGGEGNDGGGDEENAPERRTESLDEIRRSDPRFAAHIALAQRSFAEIQRHGYARGYALAGFSEKDEAQKTKMVKQEDGAATQPPQAAYTAALLLRAKRHAGDRAARTGTSAQKRESEPLSVSYEVSAQLAADDQFALLAAWELGDGDSRATRLSITPGEVRAEPKPSTSTPTTAQQKQQQKQQHGGFFRRADTTTWLLGGGVALITAGLVVLYASQRPAPVTRRRNSADNWELAPPKASKKRSKKTD